MPLYSAECANGHKLDFWSKIAERDSERFCSCGLTLIRVLAAPRLRPEIPSYQSPIDGRWIDSRAARREDLARSGSMEYDPEIKKDLARIRADNEAKAFAPLERHIEDTARALVASGALPPL